MGKSDALPLLNLFLLLLNRKVLVLEEYDSAVRDETRQVADQLIRVARREPLSELCVLGWKGRPDVGGLIDEAERFEGRKAGDGRRYHGGRL